MPSTKAIAKGFEAKYGISVQVLEARAAGADAILLIVSAHTDKSLSDLRDEAHSMNLDVLCERQHLCKLSNPICRRHQGKRVSEHVFNTGRSSP